MEHNDDSSESEWVPDVGGDVSSVPEGILELEHVFDSLNHAHRRYLCYTLLEQAEWTVRDLATKIAAWEQDIPTNTVSDHHREEVYVSLYHVHIPKLVENGIIEFDKSTEMIRAGTNVEQVLAALGGLGAALDSMQETHARSDMEDDQE